MCVCVCVIRENVFTVYYDLIKHSQTTSRMLLLFFSKLCDYTLHAERLFSFYSFSRVYSIPCFVRRSLWGRGVCRGGVCVCVCVNSEFNGNIDGTLKDFLMMVAVVVVVKGGKTKLI